MIEYKTVSLANQVFERLEADILGGRYAAGEIISENRLAKDLGVSRTPIREALSRLDDEGLVTESTSGTMVVGITDSDVDDLYQVKKLLEPMVVKRAAEKVTEEELTEIEDIVERQEFYAGKGDMEKVRDLDTDFHDLIFIASTSTSLSRILSPVHHKIMKFRKASLEADPGRAVESVKEHKGIFMALKEGDGNKAEKLMKEHLDHAYAGVLRDRKGAE